MSKSIRGVNLNQRDLFQKWEELDPVFLRGMQRSGTTIIDRALKDIGFVGFDEGHLWFELLPAIARIRDSRYLTRVRSDNHTLGNRRHEILEKYIACAIDEFHVDVLECIDTRWMDKSPGYHPIATIPILINLFPRSQVIFVYRNGVSTVHSGMKMWGSDYPYAFKIMCNDWARTMSHWRIIRDLIPGRYLELSQERMYQFPHDVAGRLTDFLGIPDQNELVASWFSSRRENTSFPEKLPGEYSYSIDWNDDHKEYFLDVCGTEMIAWGYPLDFTIGPGPEISNPRPHSASLSDFDDYARWLTSVNLDMVLREYFTFSPENEPD